MQLVKNQVCRVEYRCRDIGYGVESGIFLGYWTGEVDHWGKRTFRVIEHFWSPNNSCLDARTLYLFDDEVVEVEEPDDEETKMTIEFDDLRPCPSNAHVLRSSCNLFGVTHHLELIEVEYVEASGFEGLRAINEEYQVNVEAVYALLDQASAPKTVRPPGFEGEYLVTLVPASH